MQPNVIKKSDLDGTWYYLQTVTDAPPTSGHHVHRAVVRADEDQVRHPGELPLRAARLRADRRLGGRLQAGSGQVRRAAAGGVADQVSQFDIIRDYNSTTGEETNKIIESTERPWNEREFIRVDWSQNQVDRLRRPGINFFFDDATVSNVSYWESRSDQARRAPLRARRRRTSAEFASGRGQLLRHHQQAGGQPDREARSATRRTATQSCFTVPACFLRQQLDDCASQVVKVRHAFAKLSPKHDYQPRNWDGKQMNLFGIWDVGPEPPHLQPPVRRHQHRLQAPRGALQPVEEVVPGRRQDADPVQPARAADHPVLRRVVARAVPARAVRHRQGGHPPVERRGQVRRGRRDGLIGADKQCDRTQLQDIFVWCHNPVQARDDSMGRPTTPARRTSSRSSTPRATWCTDDDGNPIYRARQGDPRRSTIFWVNQQQNAGPLGYGPPLFDIETGETISGQAYIYGARARHLRGALARPRRLLARQAVARGLHRRRQRQGLGHRRTAPARPTCRSRTRATKCARCTRRWTSRGRAARRPRRRSTPRRRRRFMKSLQEPRGRDVQGRACSASRRPTWRRCGATGCGHRSSRR